jgi:hypothetical protein
MFCKGASKAIAMMRDYVWQLTERVIILCVSAKQDYIDIGKATKLKKTQQKVLVSHLRDVSAIDRLFTGSLTLGPCEDLGDKHVVFMFCYGSAIHPSAVLELEKCWKKFDVIAKLLCVVTSDVSH